MSIDLEKLLYDQSYSIALNTVMDRKLVRDISKNHNGFLKATGFCLITINPKDGNERDFIEKVHKIQKWKWITDMYYTFEQRGTTDIHGIHCHIVLQRGNKAPCHIKDQLYRTFMKYIGSKSCIDLKDLKTDIDVKKALQYIQGKKSDESKLEKLDSDKKMREQLGLKDFYIVSGSREDLLGSQITIDSNTI